MDINSDLGTCRPVYPFSFETGSQEYAELLKNQMEKVLTKYKHDIALKAWVYLEPHEISKLKKELSQWSSKEGTWKPE